MLGIIMTLMSASNVDDHALAVDITDLQSRHLGAARACDVKGYEQDAICQARLTVRG